MASRGLGLVAAALPMIFGALSLAFVVTSFVSDDWVRQSYFSPALQPLDWNDPLFTLHRSPFVVCGATASRPDSNTAQYDVSCVRYKVAGHGQTACQTPNETNDYTSITGDWRMCQQIHFSGNLVLASLVFVCVAFTSVFALGSLFVIKALRGHGNHNDARQHHNQHEESDSPAAFSKRGCHWHRAFNGGQNGPAHGTATKIATYWTVTTLSVAALCAFLSQFYGILGLVQSQPDNGIWASLSLGAVQDQQTGDLSHAPWVQGQVLTVYLSLAWFFGALTCGFIAASWTAQFRN
ncbi:hypothetical protein CC78DRAFT_597871 [Lojkania enalia]|uniref:Uncharacterized protein n=1 Tax=Lojkania enalia TaxID=147567 RepID=A0A9P4JWW7_9PLEO|nr:hypothetical protein CC78DRAFT_597871 [Didymosphaeria enalia]